MVDFRQLFVEAHEAHINIMWKHKSEKVVKMQEQRIRELRKVKRLQGSRLLTTELKTTRALRKTKSLTSQMTLMKRSTSKCLSNVQSSRRTKHLFSEIPSKIYFTSSSTARRQVYTINKQEFRLLEDSQDSLNGSELKPTLVNLDFR